MNPLAGRILESIKDELILLKELKELSLNFKEIIIGRDLDALNDNNSKNKATLLNMLSLQRSKDTLISELSVSLGLDKDSSVSDILESEKLDDESHMLLSKMFVLLEEKIKELKKINALVSLMLVTSYKLNQTAIDMFTLHGTIDSVYLKNVKVKPLRRHSQVNRKV